MTPEVQLGARAPGAGGPGPLVMHKCRLITGGPEELGFSERGPAPRVGAVGTNQPGTQKSGWRDLSSSKELGHREETEAHVQSSQEDQHIRDGGA